MAGQSLQDWHLDITFITEGSLDEDDAFEITEQLAEQAAVVAVSRDGQGGTISLTVQASDALQAGAMAMQALDGTSLPGPFTISAVEIRDDEERDRQLAEPAIPALVGYAEIGELAGVSRQRSRQLADQSSFPDPVVETSQGPLRTRAAVIAWLNQWDRTPGRRPSKQAAA